MTRILATALLISVTSIAFAAGTELEPTPTSQNQVRVGANEQGFIAAWNANTPTTADVHLAAIDDHGRPISEIASYFGNLGSPRIVSGPADHLFVRFTDRDLIAARVDGRGRKLQEVVIAHARAREADAVWTGAGYLLAWAENGRLFTTYLDGRREVSVRELVLPAPPPGYGRSASDVRLAFDGATALVVWIDSLMYQCGFPGCSWPEQTYAAMRLSSSGEPLDATPSPIAAPVTGAPIVAASDHNFLFLNRFDSARIITADASGIHIEPKPIDLGFHVPFDLVWNGSEYVAALGALERYVGSAAISADGVRKSLLVRNAGFARSLSVAARPDTTLVAAAVASRLEPRARTYTLSDFSAPAEPPAQPSSHARVIGPERVLLEWTAVPDADGYEIDVRREGTNERLAIIYMDADATSRLVEWGLWATYTVRAFNSGGFSQTPVAPARRRSVAG